MEASGSACWVSIWRMPLNNDFGCIHIFNDVFTCYIIWYEFLSTYLHFRFFFPIIILSIEVIRGGIGALLALELVLERNFVYFSVTLRYIYASITICSI